MAYVGLIAFLLFLPLLIVYSMVNGLANNPLDLFTLVGLTFGIGVLVMLFRQWNAPKE